jgi:hypothetical protein
MATELRPLGLGELLDRAVTLFVRNFGVLISAAAVAYVPFAIIQWATVGGILGHHRTSFTRAEWPAMGVDLGFGLLAFVLARTAVAALARAAYLSRSLSLGAAYRLAAQRFVAQLVTQLLGALIWFATLLVITLPVLVTAVITASGGTPLTVPTYVALGIAGAVALGVAAWLFLAVQLASVRIAAGVQHPYTALFAALGTVFRRPWQSLLAAFTLMLVVAGGSFLLSALGELMPTQVLRSIMLFGVASVGTILIEALSVSFLVVYDVDLAVRREGLDFAAALDATLPGPS